MILKAIKSAIYQTRSSAPGQEKIREQLLHQVALIGWQLFGTTDAERLFYIRDAKTVVWKEDDITTYYQITKHGISKTQNSHQEKKISDLEARRLLEAIYGYHRLAVGYLTNSSQPA